MFVHDGTINTLAFVPDGSYLISGGSDGKMTFIKTTNWKIDKVFEKAHKGAVKHISIHPSGKLALSIGADMTLRTWNLINGRQAFVTSLKNKPIGNIIDFVEWSRTGEYFAITGDKSVEVWSTENAEVVASQKCEARPSAVCWISDSDVLVGMENGKMLFFNTEDDTAEAKVIEMYETRIKAMKYVEGFLATCSSSGELNLWKITTDDQVEMEMICGIDVGCRLICLDIVDLTKDGIESEIKDEFEEEEKKTQVRQLKTSGVVTVEVDEEELEEEAPVKTPAKNSAKKRKSIQTKTPTNSSKKKQKRQSNQLSNGFVEEDC